MLLPCTVQIAERTIKLTGGIVLVVVTLWKKLEYQSLDETKPFGGVMNPGKKRGPKKQCRRQGKDVEWPCATLDRSKGTLTISGYTIGLTERAQRARSARNERNK